ncbi:MAG: glycerol-3-phosphate cytidylyltransferase, partial [Lachnospiraceae bacterium]|nr:glycerol-3-phosphate cytidylyltransferase [Lachnospiraceae bacterium]
FTKVDFVYDKSVASLKVAKAAKAEGELIITGTKGYIYVPSPWWKTDYFEVRFEDPAENKRHFYQLDGEGIRYEIVAFAKAVESGKGNYYISEETSRAIVHVIEEFNDRQYVLVD